MKTDVLVIGAGAMGLTLAHELARRGRTITVIDRDHLDAAGERPGAVEAPFRSASSWAAAGILPPANLETATDPIDRLRGLSHRLFPELAERLSRESGVNPQLFRCGGWYLADTIGESASMVGMISYWRELSIECEEMDLADLVRAEPAMEAWAETASRAKAWWVPDEYQINTPLFLHALVGACRKRGVRFLEQSKVVDIRESESDVSAILERPSAEQQIVHADQAVLCGGTWSGRISDRLRLSRSLVPVRGQMLLLKTKTPLVKSVINLGQRYLVPRVDGSVLVGSCEEEVGFQHGTTPGVLSDLRRFVREVCPPLASSAREVAAWSGLRPLTFDGFPMCGKLPGSKSIYVSTGHFRSGVHLSPATATCLADMMSGQQPPIPMDAFAVGKQQLQHHSI